MARRSAKSADPAKSLRNRLREYSRRRDFRVTPEPRPRPRRRGSGLRFMVHKHHARRLHYDLRLEIDGALASWAVPKGPSYDPSLKRLAIQTEDHPLEYANFEGRIPEGAYGAGDSIIWDRGTFDTIPAGQASRQRAKGHLRLALDGEKLRGQWHLLRTARRNSRSPQWLLFKASDEMADVERDVVTERPESVASGKRVIRGPAGAARRDTRRPSRRTVTPEEQGLRPDKSPAECVILGPEEFRRVVRP